MFAPERQEVCAAKTNIHNHAAVNTRWKIHGVGHTIQNHVAVYKKWKIHGVAGHTVHNHVVVYKKLKIHGVAGHTVHNHVAVYKQWWILSHPDSGSNRIVAPWCTTPPTGDPP